MSAPNELSFLPDDYLDRKRQRRTNVICATLFAMVMGTIGTTFSFSEKSLRDVEKQHAAIEQEYADAAKRIEQVQQLLAKQRTMSRQAEITASLLEKVPRSNVLAEVTNALPSGVSLTDFSLETKKRQAPPAAQTKATFQVKTAPGGAPAAPAAPEAPQLDVSMKIGGLANTDVQVAQLITKLNRCKIFKDVNLLITDTFEDPDKKEAVMRKFQIELTLNPEADVQAIKDNPKSAAVEIK